MLQCVVLFVALFEAINGYPTIFDRYAGGACIQFSNSSILASNAFPTSAGVNLTASGGVYIADQLLATHPLIASSGGSAHISDDWAVSTILPTFSLTTYYGSLPCTLTTNFSPNKSVTIHPYVTCFNDTNLDGIAFNFVSDGIANPYFVLKSMNAFTVPTTDGISAVYGTGVSESRIFWTVNVETYFSSGTDISFTGPVFGSIISPYFEFVGTNATVDGGVMAQYIDSLSNPIQITTGVLPLSTCPTMSSSSLQTLCYNTEIPLIIDEYVTQSTDYTLYSTLNVSNTIFVNGSMGGLANPTSNSITNFTISGSGYWGLGDATYKLASEDRLALWRNLSLANCDYIIGVDPLTYYYKPTITVTPGTWCFNGSAYNGPNNLVFDALGNTSAIFNIKFPYISTPLPGSGLETPFSSSMVNGASERRIFVHANIMLFNYYTPGPLVTYNLVGNWKIEQAFGVDSVINVVGSLYILHAEFLGGVMLNVMPPADSNAESSYITCSADANRFMQCSMTDSATVCPFPSSPSQSISHPIVPYDDGGNPWRWIAFGAYTLLAVTVLGLKFVHRQ